MADEDDRGEEPTIRKRDVALGVGLGVSFSMLLGVLFVLAGAGAMVLLILSVCA